MAKRYATKPKEKKTKIPASPVAKKKADPGASSKGAEYVSFRTAKELAAWDRNPRTITGTQLAILEKGLKEFGDLGGIVFNRRLGSLVGGHQRTKVLPPEARITITKAYPEATPTGTVAEGFIELNGERLAYREVEWDWENHASGAILANKAGGDWNWPEVKDLIHELDASNVDLERTGFDLPEIENIMTYSKAPEAPAGEERGKNPEDLAQGYADSALKKIELWIPNEDYEATVERIQRIGLRLNLETNTEILLKVLEDADT